MAADEQPTFRRFVRVAATHHIDADRRFAVHTVVDSFEPVIEPAQMKRRQIERRVAGELSLAGIGDVFGAVDPGADDQALEALFGFPQFDKIEVGNRCAPRVVPARRVVFRNVLVLAEVVDHTRTVVLPEFVVIAVAHGLDQPRFVIRRQFERRGSGSKRKASYVVADVGAQIAERGRGGRIRCCPRGRRERVRGSGGGVAHGQYPS